MDKEEILEKRKQNVLESYELDSQLAPCIDVFERDGDEIIFSTKEGFECPADCDDCGSVICFLVLEKDIQLEEEEDVMFG